MIKSKLFDKKVNKFNQCSIIKIHAFDESIYDEEYFVKVVEKLKNKEDLTSEEEKNISDLILHTVSTYWGLSWELAKKFNISRDELLIDATHFVWFYLLGYNKNKGDVRKFIRSILFNYIREIKKLTYKKQLMDNKIVSIQDTVVRNLEGDDERTWEDILEDSNLNDEERLDVQERFNQAIREVERLDPISSEIIKLKLDGKPYNEIASQLGIGKGSITVKIDRIVEPIFKKYFKI